MEIKASLNNLRMSPRKVRLVTDMIRGLEVGKAAVQLNFLTKRAALPIAKLLKSAVANAETNFNLNKDNLYISKILVNQGATLKRWMPRAFGRATPIMKRTSHIIIILSERKPTDSKKAKKRTVAKDNIKEESEKKKDYLEEKKYLEADEGEEKSESVKTRVVSVPHGKQARDGKRFFSRQTANLKKTFRRKSI